MKNKNNNNIEIYEINRPISTKEIEKPFFKGSFTGFMVGATFTKLFISLNTKDHFSIIMSTILLIIGLVFWYSNYDKGDIQ